jgi:hypothetical protein
LRSWCAAAAGYSPNCHFYTLIGIQASLQGGVEGARARGYAVKMRSVSLNSGVTDCGPLQGIPDDGTLTIRDADQSPSALNEPNMEELIREGSASILGIKSTLKIRYAFLVSTSGRKHPNVRLTHSHGRSIAFPL